MPATEVLKGKRKSCGCKAGELISAGNRTHGMSNTRPWNIWRSILARCENPNHEHYGRYGGRGIKVCAPWRKSFTTFWRDMQAGYRDDLTIERINNDGNYEPGNCRWATYMEQGRNKAGNREIDTPQGRMLVCDASLVSGIGVTTLLYRVNHEWPVSMLFDPPCPSNRSSIL